MNKLVLLLAVAGASMSLSFTAQAEEQQRPELRTVGLEELLEDVGRRADERFLIDRRAPARVVVGALGKSNVTYPLLLTVLRNNDLAAVRTSGVVNIVPIAAVRNFALPRVSDDGPVMHDDEWVLRLVPVSNASAAHFVPLLRPLISQAGHLVGEHGSNTLILIATYSVSERIVDIIEELDRNYKDQSR